MYVLCILCIFESWQTIAVCAAPKAIPRKEIKRGLQQQITSSHRIISVDGIYISKMGRRKIDIIMWGSDSCFFPKQCPMCLTHFKQRFPYCPPSSGFVCYILYFFFCQFYSVSNAQYFRARSTRSRRFRGLMAWRVACLFHSRKMESALFTYYTPISGTVEILRFGNSGKVSSLYAQCPWRGWLFKMCRILWTWTIAVFS